MHVLCTHPPLSPAVQHCCDARNQMIERDRNMPPEELPQIPADYDTNRTAQFKYQTDTIIAIEALNPKLAYRCAMPEPLGRRNIKNFIACVTHGLAIGAIDRGDARNMLYAARTAALSTVKRIRKKKPAEAASALALNQPEISQIA